MIISRKFDAKTEVKVSHVILSGHIIEITQEPIHNHLMNTYSDDLHHFLWEEGSLAPQQKHFIHMVFHVIMQIVNVYNQLAMKVSMEKAKLQSRKYSELKS